MRSSDVHLIVSTARNCVTMITTCCAWLISDVQRGGTVFSPDYGNRLRSDTAVGGTPVGASSRVGGGVGSAAMRPPHVEGTGSNGEHIPVHSSLVASPQERAALEETVYFYDDGKTISTMGSPREASPR